MMITNKQKDTPNFNSINQLLGDSPFPVNEKEDSNKKKMQAVTDESFEVEEILDKRMGSNNVAEYFIKWVGYPESENTWEEEDNIQPSLIEVYNKANLSDNNKKNKQNNLLFNENNESDYEDNQNNQKYKTINLTKESIENMVQQAVIFKMKQFFKINLQQKEQMYINDDKIQKFQFEKLKKMRKLNSNDIIEKHIKDQPQIHIPNIRNPNDTVQKIEPLINPFQKATKNLKDQKFKVIYKYKKNVQKQENYTIENYYTIQKYRPEILLNFWENQYSKQNL